MNVMIATWYLPSNSQHDSKQASNLIEQEFAVYFSESCFDFIMYSPLFGSL